MKAGIDSITFYCSNCNEKLTVYKNKRGEFLHTCQFCGVIIKAKVDSRRRISFEYYLPKE